MIRFQVIIEGDDCMDIVLVSGVEFVTDFSNPQLGPLILKRILEEEFDVELIDFDYLINKNKIPHYESYEKNIDFFCQYILNLEPKIVGFYTMCNSFDITLRISERIKKERPSIKIVYGGPHATLHSDLCLKSFDFLDVVQLGESELSVVSLMRALLNNSSLKDVPGIKYLENGNIIKNQRPNYLSSNELCQYTLFDFEPYIFNSADVVTIEGGRGCPFACTFCTTSIFWGRYFRVIPVDNLIEQMRILSQRYGVIKFSIIHDFFTASKKHLEEFCDRLIDEKLGFEWNCSSRVDALTPVLIKKMADSKCKDVYLGIETGSPRMQKILNKNLNLDNALETIKMMKESGLLLTTSFIYGLPEETIEDFDCTVKMIESLFLMDITNIQMHYFNIYSNTLEAEKVIDIMYFDENRLNLSLYEDKSFDDITADLIKKHPILFSHYYTFDSEIRRNYHFFETLVCCISTSSNIFSFCTKYFIRKYGLKKMYKQMEDKIIEVHEVKQYIPVNKINKTSTNYMLCEMFNDYCKKQMETIEDPVLEEIYKYESALFDFALNSGLEYLVYKSPIDIEKTIEDNAIVLNEMYYRFNKDKNEIKVSTLSPTYGLLAKLAKA